MRGLSGRKPLKTATWIAACVVSAAFLGGCSTAHYKRSADKEVYRVIQEYETRIFGKTNAFTIDTPYSKRDPDTIAPQEIIQDRMATNTQTLTIKGALELAARSRRYQAQKEQLYLTALSLTGARYAFSPQFFAGTTGRFDRESDGDKKGSLSSAAGLNQALKTGGKIGVNLANDLLRYYTGDPRRSILSVISLNLVQPLLRGGGRYSQQVENLTQAERNVVYAIRTYYHFQNQFAAEIVTDYFNLLAQKAIVRNNYTNFLRRVETTKYLEARSVDRVSKNAVDDARQAELSARISYINSLASYLNALDAFKLKLDIPLNEKIYLEDSSLRELEQAGLIGAEIDRDTAFRLAVEHHAEILNAIDQFEDAKRKVKVAANQLKAELNLVGDASLQSEPPTDYTDFDIDKVRYGVGLQLNLPLDRLQERNNYRAALISFESKLRSLALTLDTYKDKIDRGLRTLEQRRLNFLDRQTSLQVAQRRVEMNQILLEAGRVQIRDLREAQDALIAAQNNLTSTAVSYLEARLQVFLDMGILQTDVDKFWLKDPLKQYKFDKGLGIPPLRMPQDRVLPPDQFLEAKP